MRHLASANAISPAQQVCLIASLHLLVTPNFVSVCSTAISCKLNPACIISIPTSLIQTEFQKYINNMPCYRCLTTFISPKKHSQEHYNLPTTVYHNLPYTSIGPRPFPIINSDRCSHLVCRQ